VCQISELLTSTVLFLELLLFWKDDLLATEQEAAERIGRGQDQTVMRLTQEEAEEFKCIVFSTNPCVQGVPGFDCVGESRHG
jgi:hypothetical protein